MAVRGERDVAAIPKATFGEPLAESSRGLRGRIGRTAVEKTEDRHGRLLRESGARHRRRAAHKSDEIAAVHSNSQPETDFFICRTIAPWDPSRTGRQFTIGPAMRFGPRPSNSLGAMSIMIKVLYVEDNDDNVYMLKMRLELLGEFEISRGRGRREGLRDGRDRGA
jgi:hypothetical protein